MSITGNERYGGGQCMSRIHSKLDTLNAAPSNGRNGSVKEILLQAKKKRSLVEMPCEYSEYRKRRKTMGMHVEAGSDSYKNQNGHGSSFLDSSNVKPGRLFKVLRYKVPRKDFGRLDYNAAIAQRIHSILSNVNLDEPDIIKDDYSTFRVVIPNTGENSTFFPGEQVTDITKESLGKEERRVRWISLLSKEVTPFEFSEEADVLYLGENTVENLQNNPEVYSFLTLSFEKEIFAYAERALQYIKQQLAKKMDDKEKTLSYTKLEIHSLLSRKLPEHDTTAKPSSDNNELKPVSLQLVSGALKNERCRTQF